MALLMYPEEFGNGGSYGGGGTPSTEVKGDLKKLRSVRFRKDRMIFAGVLLMGILFAGIFTHRIEMENWSNVLLHSFELCLGGLIGIVTGEAASR